MCSYFFLLRIDFKPRDSSAHAKKRRKSIQKSKRYHHIKDKKDVNGLALEDGHDNVAIKTLKGMCSNVILK